MPKVESRTCEAFGAEFVLIQAEDGPKGLDWAEIRRRADTVPGPLLLPEGVDAQETGLSQPAFPAFEREVLLRTCCEMIDQSRMPVYRRVLGLVDPDGGCAAWLDRLLRHYTTVRVYTARSARYEREAERMMERYGAPVLVSDSPGILRECVLVLAPEGFTAPQDLRLDCPLLGDGRREEARTDVFSAPRVTPPTSDSFRVPKGISPHLFAGALYEHCGVEAGSLIASRLLYNLKQAVLSEAVYAMLRSAGYPAGLTGSEAAQSL